jgi:hypothetical protein
MLMGSLISLGLLAGTALPAGAAADRPGRPNPVLPGDANVDCVVNDADVQIFLTEYHKTGRLLRADFNHDRTVNVLDYNLIVENWQKTCRDIAQERAGRG